MDNNPPQRALAELEALNYQVKGILQAGRKTYWSIVQFKSDENFNEGKLWHLHIAFEDNVNPNQDKFITSVGFLSEDAPVQFFYRGSEFILIGDDLKTVKAKGVIIDLI